MLQSGNYDYPPSSHRGGRFAPRRARRQQLPASRRGGRLGIPRRIPDDPDDPDDRSVPEGHRFQHLRSMLDSTERTQRENDHFDFDRALDVLSESIQDDWTDRDRWSLNFEATRARVDHQIQFLQSDLSGREDRIRRIMSSHELSENSPTSSNLAPMNRDSNSSRSSPPLTTAVRSSRRRNAIVSGDTLARDAGIRRLPSSNSLLDDGNAPSEPASLQPESPESSRPLNRWRAKRRKLESDDYREGARGFNYGHHGQVVPGALKMEIVSCDGGTYEAEGESSWPENVLHNDSSVYCTKSDRCNLILRHRGETPFCLKKLVIKAPKSGFDSP